jgi:hypothetical protein
MRKDRKRAYSQKAIENKAWKKREEVFEVKGRRRKMSSACIQDIPSSTLRALLLIDRYIHEFVPWMGFSSWKIA